MKRFMIVLALLALAGCTGAPEGIVAVDRFDLNRYLGTWYEIVRTDNSFERGTEQVTADYSLRQDGKVRVFNKGYDPIKKQWKSVEGKAKFAGDPKIGALEVSFFGPFYGGYTVFDLDRENYSWAMVSGHNLSYLWILSRTPVMDRALVERLLTEARSKGFDTLRVIRTRQVTPAR
ncbi:MAG TPA: lipocalin family protein [Chlorobaculum sp.]|nr:lipocalin family protein [Chlorobaculum sp.]